MYTQKQETSSEQSTQQTVTHCIIALITYKLICLLVSKRDDLPNGVSAAIAVVLLLQLAWGIKCLLVTPPPAVDPLAPPFFGSTTKKTFPKSVSLKEDYHQPTAWVLAECCRLAYKGKHDVAKELTDVGFEKIIFFDTFGTQCFLAYHPGKPKKEHHKKPNRFAILAFRGTEKDYFDILTDGLFIKRKLKDEEFAAHAGFLTALQHIWGTELHIEAVEEKEDECQRDWYGTTGISNAIHELPPDTKLFITGHSLGSGIATLAAHKLTIQKSRPTVTLYTFASPRVADIKLATDLDKRENIISFRVYYRLDIAPHLLAYWPILFDYQHIRQLVYYGSKGRAANFDPPTSNRGFLTSLGGTVLAILMTLLMSFELLFFVLSIGLFFGLRRFRYDPIVFRDHRIIDYVRLLEP
jgi:hypothetical protein